MVANIFNRRERPPHEMDGVLSEGKFNTIQLKKEDPEILIIDLLKATKKSLSMSSSLAPVFYVKKPNVYNAFKETLQNENVKTRLIFDSSVSEWNTIKAVLQFNNETWVDSLIKNKTLEVRENKNIPHWIIVDDDHVRIEKSHDPGVLLTTNAIMHNIEKSNDAALKVLFSTIKSTFDSWWTISNSVT